MRDICNACQLPVPRCICASAGVVATTLKISVLQHPDERLHPKNTLRLAQLCLPRLNVFVGETTEDFTVIQQQCLSSTRRTCVIFPCETSQALENVKGAMPEHMIFIDATWRKAFKIWCTNPWLHALPCYHFNHAPASQYLLRKTSRAQGLSSLEAIAYGLNLAENIEVAPLYAVQQSWIDQKRAMMPKDVQKRYES